MRILFICRRFSYLKNFEAPILELASRGHDVHLAALASEGQFEGTALVQRWADANPRITFEPFREDIKVGLRSRIRMMMNYLRYLEPEYRGADGLTKRAVSRTPAGFLRLLRRPGARSVPSRRTIAWALDHLERATPRRAALDDFLRAQAPDVVLFTPLITLQSEEQDLLAAALERGVRTVFCVLSWDNLSSKAILRAMPDLVTVWNDVQRDEAHRIHGVPLDRIAVTGAQNFDQWFDRAPSRSREAFAARVGLPAQPPFLMWVCSALFHTSPDEAPFVRRWIHTIRSSNDRRLAEVPILVRPHPSRMAEWKAVSLDGLGPVVLYGRNPIETGAKNDYFDSLYYSAAVVGLNTSAFLEAAIVGRSVYTILLPEFHESQEGTLHFPYLLHVGGGLLHAAHDMPTHIADLSAALRDPAAGAERSRRFVETFVRPHGLGTRATDRFVDTVEALMRRPAASPQRALQPGLLAERLYAWLEPRSREGSVKAWLTTPNEMRRQQVKEAKLARARAREARKKQFQEAKLAKARAREAGLAERGGHEQAMEEKRRRREQRLEEHRAAKRKKKHAPEQSLP